MRSSSASCSARTRPRRPGSRRARPARPRSRSSGPRGTARQSFASGRRCPCGGTALTSKSRDISGYSREPVRGLAVHELLLITRPRSAGASTRGCTPPRNQDQFRSSKPPATARARRETACRSSPCRRTASWYGPAGSRETLIDSGSDTKRDAATPSPEVCAPRTSRVTITMTGLSDHDGRDEQAVTSSGCRSSASCQTMDEAGEKHTRHVVTNHRILPRSGSSRSLSTRLSSSLIRPSDRGGADRRRS